MSSAALLFMTVRQKRRCLSSTSVLLLTLRSDLSRQFDGSGKLVEQLQLSDGVANARSIVWIVGPAGVDESAISLRAVGRNDRTTAFFDCIFDLTVESDFAEWQCSRHNFPQNHAEAGKKRESNTYLL